MAAIQYYLYVTWPFFFAFWIRTPRFWILSPLVVFSFFTVLHLVYGYAFGLGESLLEFLILKPVLILFSSALLGGALANSLSMPETAILSYTWKYFFECIFLATLWIGAGISWQIAPQTFWNYFFIVSGSHILIILVSYLFVYHNQAWKVPNNAHDSRLVHFHFFIVNSLMIDAVFSIGQTANNSFNHVYYAIIALLVGFTYALTLNFQLQPEPNIVYYSPYPPNSDLQERVLIDEEQ